ncbi:acyl-protein thioesterase 1-like [Salvia hispanica]|uniref:acyl-protein thioesterase 1-like n=1 Tax=Salvia hispanica TaxID=49212 RepID=UPI002009B1D5|nr:acyl-protein thioesterase 1-like [Salvia hispanica]
MATAVLAPTGEHKATIVWLHCCGETGGSWPSILEQLNLPNIKWICPTAPRRPVTAYGGRSFRSWFDVDCLSTEDTPRDDLDGLDASAAVVANLLSSEPPGIKLGVGGLGMGAAVALYSAICLARRRYNNAAAYPNIRLTAVLALNGWLPQASTMSSIIPSSRNPAAHLPIFLAHGLSDEIVYPSHSHTACHVLTSSGFQNIAFDTYGWVGHFLGADEREDIRNWLNAVMQF